MIPNIVHLIRGLFISIVSPDLGWNPGTDRSHISCENRQEIDRASSDEEVKSLFYCNFVLINFILA